MKKNNVLTLFFIYLMIILVTLAIGWDLYEYTGGEFRGCTDFCTKINEHLDNKRVSLQTTLNNNNGIAKSIFINADDSFTQGAIGGVNDHRHKFRTAVALRNANDYFSAPNNAQCSNDRNMSGDCVGNAADRTLIYYGTYTFDRNSISTGSFDGTITNIMGVGEVTASTGSTAENLALQLDISNNEYTGKLHEEFYGIIVGEHGFYLVKPSNGRITNLIQGSSVMSGDNCEEWLCSDQIRVYGYYTI